MVEKEMIKMSVYDALEVMLTSFGITLTELDRIKD